MKHTIYDLIIVAVCPSVMNVLRAVNFAQVISIWPNVIILKGRFPLRKISIGPDWTFFHLVLSAPSDQNKLKILQLFIIRVTDHRFKLEQTENHMRRWICGWVRSDAYFPEWKSALSGSDRMSSSDIQSAAHKNEIIQCIYSTPMKGDRTKKYQRYNMQNKKKQSSQNRRSSWVLTNYVCLK